MKRLPDMTAWSGGRADTAETGPSPRVHDVIRPLASSGGGVALIGFACDEGVRRNQGRTGAADGPAAIRHALRNLAVHRDTTLYDAGDIVCDGEALEQAQAALGAELASLLARGVRPVVLGGGHEVAYASYLGLRQHHGAGLGGRRLLVINIDAHFDLRHDVRPSSGTPFRQILEHCQAEGTPCRYACLGLAPEANTRALFERAHRFGAIHATDTALSADTDRWIGLLRDELLPQSDLVYLSIDLDALPGDKAPGVSAPAAHGVALPIVERLVRTVLDSGRLALADLAEMNPRYDRDGLTARIAARLVHRLAELMPPVIEAT